MKTFRTGTKRDAIRKYLRKHPSATFGEVARALTHKHGKIFSGDVSVVRKQVECEVLSSQKVGRGLQKLANLAGWSKRGRVTGELASVKPEAEHRKAELHDFTRERAIRAAELASSLVELMGSVEHAIRMIRSFEPKNEMVRRARELKEELLDCALDDAGR